MIINSEELFFLSCEEDLSKKIIYAPLRSYLALAKNEVVESIKSHEYSTIKNRFFNMLSERQLLNMTEIINNLHKVNPELSLAITDNCNLRCLYCHASAGDAHKLRTMSYKMIDAIIKKYFEFINDTETIRVSMNGGGEPTYNFKKLEYAIKKVKEYASQRNIKCNLSMATNGVYGNTVRNFIIKEFADISLSFDGPAHIQNLHRPMANGKGSFPNVYETAKYFYDSGFNFAFRATVSDYSIDYLEEMMDFFATNFPNKSIGLENLNPFGRGRNCNKVKPPNKIKFAERIIDMLCYTKDKPIKILNSATTDYDLIRPVFCTNVGIPSWTVDVNGDIYACHRDDAPDDFTFGKYDIETNSLILDYNKINKIRDMVVFNYDECADCFCKYHCAGDCPDRRLSDKLNCVTTQNIGLNILNNKLSNNKELKYANKFS
ncbi:MAG: radical SAM protein [Bacteroidota bacterium]|jgi:radical SAM protein with 4Fe4S-binding SPASM domain